MKLVLEIHDTFCSPSEFTINEVTAEWWDFGGLYDNDPDAGGEYSCGDNQFEVKEPINKVLEKYKICKTEYYLIADQLKEGLSFGNCDLCR